MNIVNKYQIWLEGFCCTGNSSKAQFKGVWCGTTFQEACMGWAKSTEAYEYYNFDNNTYWGCRLFDN